MRVFIEGGVSNERTCRLGSKGENMIMFLLMDSLIY